jgi:hypothetical protein
VQAGDDRVLVVPVAGQDLLLGGLVARSPWTPVTLLGARRRRGSCIRSSPGRA